MFGICACGWLLQREKETQHIKKGLSCNWQSPMGELFVSPTCINS